ncbi:hypothetical protein N5C80_23140 [Pseudomonas nicosulfuronedens]|uniref:hypothetical protein n=1 Tax=Pseudomonas TaxID=286 RepID=UPI0024476DCD|nr:hypothetical protein [Pseudomonas nicosulfuronedens]MDH1011635.1 hypothetical protein [Pseudomonas nicosulfuronedens]MDH2027372.1 hypothetical protein [Pseudomonas nicosulfuronedens]
MSRNRSTEEVRVTLAELSFQNEAAAVVLERAALELPSGLGCEVTEVIELLRRHAVSLRSLAERVQDGGIAALQ